MRHFIAISSIYKDGIRIAWHYSADSLDINVIDAFFAELKKKHGDIQMGIHKITTDSDAWESVIKKDKYFEDLIVVTDYKDFIKLVGEDRTLTAFDVAKYILTTLPTTHLKLQKLLYFSYVEFLKRTGEPLFKDDIYAWKHGPVVESVYHEFKGFGKEQIDYEEDDTITIIPNEVATNPSFMRIVLSEHGSVAIDSIFDVLDEFGLTEAWELVEKTHVSGGPWDKVYAEGINKTITDDDILVFG